MYTKLYLELEHVFITQALDLLEATENDETETKAMLERALDSAMDAINEKIYR